MQRSEAAKWFWPFVLVAALAAAIVIAVSTYVPPKATPGNRLAYLDDLDPYYPHARFPKFTTPQYKKLILTLRQKIASGKIKLPKT